MKKAFRDAYNTELGILREQAAEFARTYPGLADRLGGLLEDNLDPTIAGLLEGSAFMAARVQLKLEEEFRGFSSEMLDQLLPGLQDPVPAAMLVRAETPYASPDLTNGLHFQRGEALEASYTENDRRVHCKFSLVAPLSLWPIDISELKYLSTKGQLGLYQPQAHVNARNGLMIEIARRSQSGQLDDKETLSALKADDLKFHFTGPLEQSVALYEQLHARCLRVSLRWQGPHKTEVVALPKDAIQQIGFGSLDALAPHEAIDNEPNDLEETLFTQEDGLFRGYRLLQEAFVYPRRFLGFRLTGLRRYWAQNPTARMQIVFEFDKENVELKNTLEKAHVTLHAAPAVNLFIEDASPIRMDLKRHEMTVTPLSSPLTHYEFHRVTDVWAHFAGGKHRARVLPLYDLPLEGADPRQTIYFTQKRKPRRLTSEEKTQGVSRQRYRGTETYISLYAPADGRTVQRLEARGWCSNRHLTEMLPISQGKNDFYFCDQSDVRLACVDGPTPPRPALTEIETASSHRQRAGDAHWRLLSYLQMNAQGLSHKDPVRSAAALREILSLFTDLSDLISETQIGGIIAMETELESGQIVYDQSFLTVRGLGVKLTFDEAAFEGSGVMLLAAIVDRFLADFAAINSFTRTRVFTVQRGEIHAFPRRVGHGRLL